MHFYDFNIGDYAKKTQHLTNEEDLAYRRLLDMYYDAEKPIANPSLNGGLTTLSRRLRVSEDALKNVLDEFFPDGKNKHADEKIAAYYEFIAKQSANGKRGGRPKHKVVKPTANPPITQALPTVNPSPNQPLPTNHLPKEKILSEYSDDFTSFWSAYPKKTGKDKAWQLWKKLKPSLDDVLKALSWQRVSEQWINNFIPNPETYLNQGRWKDEPTTPTTSTGNSVKSICEIPLCGKFANTRTVRGYRCAGHIAK